MLRTYDFIEMILRDAAHSDRFVHNDDDPLGLSDQALVPGVADEFSARWVRDGLLGNRGYFAIMAGDRGGAMEEASRDQARRLAERVRNASVPGRSEAGPHPLIVLGDPGTDAEWQALQWALEGFPGPVFVVSQGNREHPGWKKTASRTAGGLRFLDPRRERDLLSFWARVTRSAGGYLPVLLFRGDDASERQALLAQELGLKVATLVRSTGEEPPGAGAQPGALLPLPLDQAVFWCFLRGPAPRLPDDLRQRLGRLLHESYVKARLAEGASPEPSLAPWEDLPEDLRESNCRQAEDMHRKLELLGWRIVPLLEGGQGLDLSDGDVEWLAVIEHGRWVIERLLAGWRWGPVKDVTARRSPYLVPFLELDEPNREKDRQAVRKIPDLLEAGGYGVQRPPLESGSGQQGLRRWIPWLRVTWPLVLAGMFLTSFLLGVEGFRRQACEMSEGRECDFFRSAAFFQTIQLFGLEYSGGATPNGFLDIARFLAPFTALATAVAAFVDLFSQRLRLFWATARKGHVVICGLGETGYGLADRYRKKGDRVVAVELDGECDFIPPLRTSGGAVVVGDAMETPVLEIARTRTARLVVTATGDGAANLAIARNVAEMLGRSGRGDCRVIAHVADDYLLAFFRGSILGGATLATDRGSAAPQVDCVNLFDHAAERLVWDLDFRKADRTRLAIVGTGWMGRSLIVRTAHAWFWRHWWDPREGRFRDAGPRLRITMVDREAHRVKDLLTTRYPVLEAVADLQAVDADVETAAFYRDFLEPMTSQGDGPPLAFVCLGNDTRSLLTAKVVHDGLHHRFPGVATTVMVTGLGGVARLAEKEKGRGPGIRFFGLREEACRPEVFEQAPYEGIAREFHQVYLRHEMQAHRYNPARASHQPWCRLPASYRDSNHRLARHVPVKLQAVGCTLVPRFDWRQPWFEFSPEEVETLARMEHDRWRTQDAGPGHLANVAWERLQESDRDRARHMIRQHPLVLAKAGFNIERIAAHHRPFLG